MKVFRRITKLVFWTILFLFVYSLGVVVYDQVKINQMVNEFKQRAISHTIVELFDTTFHYYEVERVHPWEISDQRNAFSDSQRLNPGQKGDILATTESPFPYLFGIHQIVSAYFGGHAALVTDANTSVQSTGIGPDGTIGWDLISSTIMHSGYAQNGASATVSMSNTSDWMTPMRTEGHPEYPYYGNYYRNTFMGLRVKFEDEAQRDIHIDQAVDYAIDKVGTALYNYLFIFDTKYKYYCSDLVSRAYQHVNQIHNTNYRLNADGFITSVQDLMISSDTYLTIYKETNSEGIHIYYLEDVL